MPDVVIKQVDNGFNAHVRDASELERGSAVDGSKNVLYSRGTIKTPFGFDKVASSSLPLDGAPVVGIFLYPELDRSEHLLAVTTTKIFNRNNITDAFDDVTQSGADLGAAVGIPLSQAVVGHTDGLALNGSSDLWYWHSVICPGKTAKLQRWAGDRETDYADVLGGTGYHDTSSNFTGHYALQVGINHNHVLLINPREADSNNELVDNPQRIRYGAVGKLETWNGDGTGSYDLLDSGDYNIWGANLGKQWIQYQSHSIWSLTHIGGTRVFAPRLEMPDLGLLSATLLFSKNNIHYFIGNDFHVYAYVGGTFKNIIGNNIHRYLQRDLDPQYASRSWLTMGANSSRLWLYIVPNGQTYVTEGYGMDLITGKWMKRDFTHKWTTNATGISAVGLIGASSYETGLTYAELLTEKSPAKAVAIGGCVRSTNVVTVTTTEDVGHGFITSEKVVLTGVDSGGEADAFSGTHTSITRTGANTFTFAQTGADESNLAAGTVLVDKAPNSTDYGNLALTSRQMLTEVLTGEAITLGDADGNVYQFSASATQDDGVDIPALHITEIYDGGKPGLQKLWIGLRFTAKGTGVIVSYRTSDFETTGTGWTAFAAQALTSNFTTYDVFIEDTSDQIQFRFTNANSDDFQISNYTLMNPTLVEMV